MKALKNAFILFLAIMIVVYTPIIIAALTFCLFVLLVFIIIKVAMSLEE